MELKHLPNDINIEEVLLYLPKESYKIAIKGAHKRNAYKDILDINKDHNGNLICNIGRNSIYNSLPEFLFHAVNRFDNIPENERKERFDEECEKQEKEKQNAHEFFSPIDLLLLKIKLDVRKKINEYSKENKIIQDIIGDSLTEEEKKNPFVKNTIQYLPYCKNIRGNKTLLTLILRQIFKEENIILEKTNKKYNITDINPKYDESVGKSINNMYVGNKFSEEITTFTLKFWPSGNCDDRFMDLINDIKIFKNFIQEYFISIEENIQFIIVNEEESLRLYDGNIYNYLNYNTNII